MINTWDTHADFTGTKITSDKPVAVVAGHKAALIPAGVAAGDHLIEQMLPTSLWGRRYVTFPLETRSGGDRYRILACSPGTKVSINGRIVATLEDGQFHEAVLADPSSIVSNNPIQVAQFSQGSAWDATTGDPAMTLLPPVESFGNSYQLRTPVFHLNRFDWMDWWDYYNADENGMADVYDSYLNVVIESSHRGEVTINGVLIPDSEFREIGGSGVSGASLPVQKNSLLHLSAPVSFGAWLYGFAFYESYAFMGGYYFNRTVTTGKLSSCCNPRGAV